MEGYVKYGTDLYRNVEMTVGGICCTLYETRGRGYASAHEAWAAIRQLTEKVGIKELSKLEGDIWNAAKEGNSDAYTAYLDALQRLAIQNAWDMLVLAGKARLAIERTGQDQTGPAPMVPICETDTEKEERTEA